MADPLISVICPTFNRSARVLPTIDSVVAQTRSDWELIVVSDGSTDDTDHLVRGYPDRRVRLERIAHHGHPGPPRNHGLRVARGRYVAYLDHDDLWGPEHLDALAGVLGRGARLAATGCVYAGEDGTTLGGSTRFDGVWHADLMVLRPRYEPSRVAHVRGLIESAGGWETTPHGFEDWATWLRLTDAGERFEVNLERTARIVRSADGRRHRTPRRHHLALGTTTDRGTADRVAGELNHPETLSELRACGIRDQTRWLGALARRGELWLPGGTTAADLPELVACLPGGSPGVVVMRCAGGWRVAVPLDCVHAEHAARLAALIRAVFVEQFGYLRGLLAAYGMS